jgi:hypothetical protein
MVNPQQDCTVAPTKHAKMRFLSRGLSKDDLEQMVREGRWRTEGTNSYDCIYRGWHVKIQVGQCTIKVVTAFRE